MRKVLSLITVAALAGCGSHGPLTSPATVAPTTPVRVSTAPVPPSPSGGPTLTAAQLTLTPKVIKQRCFGSAGCNVALHIDTAYEGPPLSDQDVWLVTYEITGDADGPQIGSLTITGTAVSAQEEDLDTESAKTRISIKVTDVTKS